MGVLLFSNLINLLSLRRPIDLFVFEGDNMRVFEGD